MEKKKQRFKQGKRYFNDLAVSIFGTLQPTIQYHTTIIH